MIFSLYKKNYIFKYIFSNNHSLSFFCLKWKLKIQIVKISLEKCILIKKIDETIDRMGLMNQGKKDLLKTV